MSYNLDIFFFIDKMATSVIGCTNAAFLEPFAMKVWFVKLLSMCISEEIINYVGNREMSASEVF